MMAFIVLRVFAGCLVTGARIPLRRDHLQWPASARAAAGHSETRRKSVKRSYRSMLLAGSLIALGCATNPVESQVPQPQQPPFIQVSGSAQVFVPSDRARLNFAVVTEAATAAAAAAQNSTQMETTIRALRGTGIAGLQIESWGYDLQPRYAMQGPNNPDQPPRIVGYHASNNVRVTVDDVSAVGRLIDAGVTAGANRVTSLQFEARNTDAAKAEALRRAVQNARSQAEAMASALGVPLGPALEVQGGSDSFVPPMPYMRAMDMVQAAPPTPIEAAAQSVSANVSIKYRLGNP
jgi:uncharacterized protein YggE